MKIISTLVGISILFSGCAVGNFPKAPEVKKQYLVQVKDEQIPAEIFSFIVNTEEMVFDEQKVNCLEFDIVSWHPYKIKYVSVVDIKECHLMGGFKHKEIQGIFNWVDDVYEWAKDRKTCFKN